MNNLRVFASLTAWLLAAAGVVGLVLWNLGTFQQDQHWTIATGTANGNYARLGEQLATRLNERLAPSQNFETLASAGSAENMTWLGAGKADFAIVQSDTATSQNARLIATLYDELLHVLVRSDLLDQDGVQVAGNGLSLEFLGTLKSVSIGPMGSGTSQVAQLLLDHFEIELRSPARRVALGELGNAFATNELDAALVLAAPGSQLVEDLLDSGAVRLLSIGEGPAEGSPADAIARLHPAMRPCLLPARLYGKQPSQAVQSLGVSALLIASDHVDSTLVRKVTRELFSHRHQLARELHTPLALHQDVGELRKLMPIHRGAEAYYHRENPSFLVIYAEVIALGITLLIGLWSMIRLFIRWLADVKKERIDRFYREVRQASDLDQAKRLEVLREIHNRAFDQLIEERLLANESFVIFHDYLLSEIARAERNA